MSQFDCRFCGGVRDHNGKFCMGCGSPVANARNKNKPKPKKPRCPKCRSHRHKPLEDNTLQCQKCGSWFDPQSEIAAVDTRPEQNAIKRERSSQRKRYGHY